MIEFPSLAHLAHHLVLDAVGGLEGTKDGLEEAAALLEKTAKAEFGTYQDAIGTFAAWAELADSTKADRAAKGYAENDPLLRDGTLRDSIEHEVEEWTATVGSTSELMPYFEFGTSKMPPRPVLGPALYHQADKIAKMIGGYAAHGLIGGKPIHSTLGYDIEREG
jgi:HK97 gp10 family phage protein